MLSENYELATLDEIPSYYGTETLSETPSSGTETDYIRAGGFLLVKVTGSTTGYCHADSMGSTHLVTDSRARVSFADNYLPFGQDNGTPTGSETYKFTGKPVSQTTCLYYYYYYRWYDSSIGCFRSI